MSYCLTSNCPKPANPPHTNYCQNCGSKLLLKDRYQAIKPIGAGGMGKTFLAKDTHRLNTDCLIKQLSPSPHIQNNPETMAKATRLFKREARQLFHLGNHPQIPTMLAFFEENRQLYLVQELIEGQDLSQQSNFTYNPEQIELFLTDLLPVLQFIHENNVIHRDIKPANILRRTSLQKTSTLSRGDLILIDFGICKEISPNNLTNTGSFVGTEGYAPIEQLRGGKAYPASDLYSLGVTCIQLLTGHSLEELYDPMQGRWNWQDYLNKKGEKISHHLTKILEKMLQDSLKERYQEAAEILNDLHNIPAPIRVTGTQPAFSKNTSQKTSPHFINKNLKTSPTWQCLQILTGHSNEVNAIVISPQSYILASASWDQTVKIWNFKTGQLLHTLRGHQGYVNCLAISSDGYTLASGSWDRTIKLWHTGTGKLIHTLKGHSNYIHSLAITPNNQHLISSSRDKTIKIWELNTGTPLYSLNTAGCVRSLDISSDGTLLATGSDDRTLKLWQISSGLPSLTDTLTEHTNWVRSVAFSPNRQLVASGSWDTKISLCLVQPGGKAKSIATLSGHTCYIYSIRFSSDSQMLASGSKDGTIKLWDLQHPRCVHTLSGHSGPVYAVAFCGRKIPMLASAGDDGSIRIWGVAPVSSVKT
ncbi:serine/threonine protein kinase [Ancylothrix sp. C2]|uniref:serine/threonine-protein kinase n=1 Tax=Ancylothrix sp. D3o TaxID=2953691 RepID=UPI0021BA65E2|nr:serine/threonine-protein kinase [Ancylothrix sp. D3o]MCT7950149.1 serine/threonine protein kinase [Ancylothrix sp. D3o]